MEERTGYRLVKDEPSGDQPGMGAPFMNKVGRRKEKGESEDTTLPTSSFLPSPSPILDAFAKDTGPAAEAIKELLKTIESGGDAKAEAASLIEKLPDLMPEDPAMSAVIAEAMAAEFAEVSDGRAARPAQPLANKDDQPRGKTTEDSTSGSFAPSGGVSSKKDRKKPKRLKRMPRMRQGRLQTKSEGCRIWQQSKTEATATTS